MFLTIIRFLFVTIQYYQWIQNQRNEVRNPLIYPQASLKYIIY